MVELPAGPLHRIALESFLIAGLQMIRAVILINDSCTLYDSPRTVIESRELMTAPRMTDGQRTNFVSNVRALFKAGWNTKRIRDRAISVQSGFGRFWESPRHALNDINAIVNMHVYEVRPRKDKRGFDLISDAASWIRSQPPSAFHPLAQRFPSPRCASAIQIVRP